MDKKELIKRLRKLADEIENESLPAPTHYLRELAEILRDLAYAFDYIDFD